jgi:hypothetical protein
VKFDEKSGVRRDLCRHRRLAAAAAMAIARFLAAETQAAWPHLDASTMVLLAHGRGKLEKRLAVCTRAESRNDRLPAMAAELVHRRISLIFTPSLQTVRGES